MRFLLITLIVHAPHPITGVQRPTTDRFREVLDNARFAIESVSSRSRVTQVTFTRG